jgi:hypothetical protein
MKNSLFALCVALFLTSCADVRITHTDVATGVTNPSAIYIKPFDVSDCTFTGKYVAPAERSIKESLAPAIFAEDLKEELEKIAPAIVLKPGDYPTSGWLVEGSIDNVDAGHPGMRGDPFTSQLRVGASHIAIHVRVIDLDLSRSKSYDSKDVGSVTTIAVTTDATDLPPAAVTTGTTDANAAPVTTGTTEATASANPAAPVAPAPHIFKKKTGVVIYEFDMAGGSKSTGFLGSTTAAGLGYAPMFDYRNAAERVYEALDPDEFTFGIRDSPTIR